MRGPLGVYLKGFLMGAADVVPGVSGGTIALILGIYDRLIRAITAFDPRGLAPALRAHRTDEREALQEELERMDVFFLLSLGLGIATAVVVLSRVMASAAEGYPVPTYAFFFGLIAASAIVLYREVGSWTPGRIAVSAVGVTLAFLITGLTGSEAPHGPLVIFVTGAIAICAMVLPGVSGAFFLLILGQYEYLTGTLRDFTDGLLAVANGGSLTPVLESGTTVAIFGVGAVIGLITMAHLIERALDRYREATLAFLVSLMVGALRFPAMEVTDPDNLGQTAGGSLEVAALAAVVGCAAVLLVDHYTDDLAYA
ncbi:DUF368 domain-containing protein [Natronobiforma cellulositropha]|uniref:DUF368 domain-containing protein n=1 Tax=Natronobiforma cellulositropha TaxID=1679076 RepID=UPI0021D569DF|nr:DUF368 domain-containing protein [Natronobiforma cellulositropha]